MGLSRTAEGAGGARLLPVLEAGRGCEAWPTNGAPRLAGFSAWLGVLAAGHTISCSGLVAGASKSIPC